MGLFAFDEEAETAASVVAPAAGAVFGPIGSFFFAAATYFLYGALADVGVPLFLLDAIVDGTVTGLYTFAFLKEIVDPILQAVATYLSGLGGANGNTPQPSPAPTPGTPSAGGSGRSGPVMLDTSAVYHEVTTKKFIYSNEHPVIDEQVWFELEQNQRRNVRDIPPYAETLPQIPDVINPLLTRSLYETMKANKPNDPGNAGDAIIGTTAISDGYPLVTFEKTFAAVVRYFGGDVRLAN